MDTLGWLFFIAVTILFSSILAIILKAVLGKYLAALVPIPLIFLIALIALVLIAAQAAGLPVSALYANFFSWLSGILNKTSTTIGGLT